MSEEVEILYETQSGRTSEFIASEGYRVFSSILGLTAGWDDLIPGDRERWRDSSAHLFMYVAHEKEAKFSQLAMSLLNDLMVPSENEVEVAASAAVRHMANLMLAETNDDVSDAVSFSWPEWAAAKMGQPTEAEEK